MIRWENNHVSFEAILSEVRIEGKRLVESVMVDQSKTGAIDEAEVFIVVSDENTFCYPFYRLTNTKDSDSSLIKIPHEIDGSSMADFRTDECVGLGKNEIGR